MLLAVRDTHQRALVLALIAALVAIAWASTVALGPALMPGMGGTPSMSSTRGMQGMGTMPGMSMGAAVGSISLFSPIAALLFLAAWVLMTAAMMLPSTLSMIDTFATLARGRPRSALRIASFLLGYLAAWSVVGVGAYAVALGLEVGARRSESLMSQAPLLTAGALILAGLYQFTPLKNRCLQSCRSPLGFLMNRWKDGVKGALRMGASHGVFCIGCCWALMALMLVVGMTQLVWMVGLAALMFVEKIVRRGEIVGYAVGAAFLVAGLGVALSPIV